MNEKFNALKIHFWQILICYHYHHPDKCICTPARKIFSISFVLHIINIHLSFRGRLLTFYHRTSDESSLPCKQKLSDYIFCFYFKIKTDLKTISPCKWPIILTLILSKDIKLNIILKHFTYDLNTSSIRMIASCVASSGVTRARNCFRVPDPGVDLSTSPAKALLALAKSSGASASQLSGKIGAIYFFR